MVILLTAVNPVTFQMCTVAEKKYKELIWKCLKFNAKGKEKVTFRTIFKTEAFCIKSLG